MTPTPIQTLTPSITPEPTTGDIHGFVRYACNDQLVYTSHHFAIFESGEEWSLATTVVNVSGEFWFRYLAPGWYDVYEYMITNNTGYDYGVKRSVNVKAGQTSEITMYTEKCPLLNLVYPIGGEMISETRPVFQWQPYDVGSSYQVRVEEVGQEGGLMLNEPTLLTYKESDFELEPGKTYQWYVCVLDPTIPGCKEASLFETFQVEEP
jgi:hypothetical protein